MYKRHYCTAWIRFTTLLSVSLLQFLLLTGNHKRDGIQEGQDDETNQERARTPPEEGDRSYDWSTVKVTDGRGNVSCCSDKPNDRNGNQDPDRRSACTRAPGHVASRCLTLPSAAVDSVAKAQCG